MGEAGADAARTSSSGLFLGLITLAGKILDNFGGQESAVEEQQEQKSLQQQKGLIDEIFTRFLFPVVFAADG